MRPAITAFILLALTSTATAAEAPAWLLEPTQPGKLCAVGVGQSRRASVARSKASMRARTELMKTLDGTVSEVITTTYIELKDALTGEVTVETLVKRVTTVTVKGKISGVTDVDAYTDAATNETYVLACLDAAAARTLIKENLDRYVREGDTFKPDKAKQVLEILDRAVDRTVK